MFVDIARISRDWLSSPDRSMNKYNSKYDPEVTYKSDKNFLTRLKAMIDRQMKQAGIKITSDQETLLMESLSDAEDHLFFNPPTPLEQSEDTLRGNNVPQQTGDGYPTRTIGEVCTLKFGDLTPHIPATVRGIHQYHNKVKYDLELAILFEDGWHTTRIYNVDAEFVCYGDVPNYERYAEQ